MADAAGDSGTRGAAAGIALGARRAGAIDVSARTDADHPLAPGGDLPFRDRSLGSLWLGDAAAALAVREQLWLLAECRRVLAPGARLLLPEPRAAETATSLARWAALVGLAPLPAGAPAQGWCKHAFAPAGTPLVSILLPAANPRHFAASLDSALAQAYAPVEIVIGDDSEGDAIAALIATRTAAAAERRVDLRHVRNPQRLRARANFANLLALARGEYVKFLTDDDVLEPQCVATLVAAFEQVPDIVLATSHRWRIDADSRVIADMPATRPVVDRDLIVNGQSLANAVILYGLNFIGEPSTALFRRRDLGGQRIGGSEPPFHFDGEEVRGAIDLAMWSRLLVRGNAAFFAARLSRFRAHREQAQAKPEVVARSIAGIRGLQRRWIDLGLHRPFPPHLLRCQPFPVAGTAADEWSLETVRSLPPAPLPPDAALRAWRSIERHPFEDVATA
jgi:hypothetical protein